MPGVPDVYQGTELWDDSLVDPTTGVPSTSRARSALLAALSGAPPVDATGAAKLWVTAQALRTRRERPDLFTGYTPIRATGAAADHLVAFDRGGVLTFATRLPVGLGAAGGWRDTTIGLVGSYRDAFTGRTWSGAVEVGEVLSELPVALLVRE